MYTEEAEVKTYYRKNSKGAKKPFNQINLGNKSKFKNEEKVVIVNAEDYKEFESKANTEYIATLEETITDSEEDNKQLQQQLKQLKEEKEAKIIEANSKIEEANTNVIEAKDKIEKIQEDHKKEMAELNTKLNNEKDFSKALLVAMNDLNKRNFFSRLINKEPDSVKKVLELKPIEISSNGISKDK